jgi:hypothetical protein
MNTNVEVLNTKLANKIQQNIKIITHHDEIGFTSEIQRQFNIKHFINVVHHVNRPRQKNNRIKLIHKIYLTKFNAYW